MATLQLPLKAEGSVMQNRRRTIGSCSGKSISAKCFMRNYITLGYLSVVIFQHLFET